MATLQVKILRPPAVRQTIPWVVGNSLGRIDLPFLNTRPALTAHISPVFTLLLSNVGSAQNIEKIQTQRKKENRNLTTLGYSLLIL